MPKASSLVTDRERAICLRFREVRCEQRWPQREFANSLGLTRNMVAAIEAECTPVQYWVGRQLCAQFNVSQSWLADGTSPKLGYVPIPSEIEAEITPRELFSAAHQRRIGHIVKGATQDAEALKLSIAAEVGGADRLLQDRIQNLTLCWFQRIPPHLYQEYFGLLMAVSSDFFMRNRHRFSTTTWPPPILGPNSATQATSKDDRKMLTEVTPERNLAGMTEIALLLQRLKRALEGLKKGDLARSLKVPLPRVSEWLSGRVVPSGETALRLLHWVEQREQKLNTLGSAINTAKGKTQPRSSKANEKTKSNPQKG